MFRSLSDHHQGDTIFVLTSLTKVIDVAACLLALYLPDDGHSVTETCRRSFRVLDNTYVLMCCL